VLVYQETYHRETYHVHHPKGRKSDFAYRLDAPDRVGAAGVHKIGLGALFGLEDWRAECFFTALHLRWLERKHWRSRFSVSFPRIRPHEGELQPKVEMTDRDLVQTICAFRLLSGEVELTLSTRESRKFRDHACRVGVTAMSAGSHTNPGGYAEGREASLEQFAIEDDRSPTEVAAMLRGLGYEPVWKDWDPSTTNRSPSPHEPAPRLDRPNSGEGARQVVLSKEESAHLVRSLRARRGDALVLLDGHGLLAEAKLLTADPAERRGGGRPRAPGAGTAPTGDHDRAGDAQGRHDGRPGTHVLRSRRRRGHPAGDRPVRSGAGCGTARRSRPAGRGRPRRRASSPAIPGRRPSPARASSTNGSQRCPPRRRRNYG
jgi:hypothetical protein